MSLSPRLKEYAKQLKKLKEEKSAAEDKLSAINKKLEIFSDKYVELMQDYKIKSYTVAGVGTPFTYVSYMPTIKDQKKFFAYLRKNRFGSLIKETVHPQTLKAFTKESIEERNVTPKGLSVFIKTKVGIRKRGSNEKES